MTTKFKFCFLNSAEFHCISSHIRSDYKDFGSSNKRRKEHKVKQNNKKARTISK